MQNVDSIDINTTLRCVEFYALHYNVHFATPKIHFQTYSLT